MRRLMVFSLAYAGAVFLAQYMLPGGGYLPAGFLCALIALALLLTPGPRRRVTALAAFGLSVGFAWCFGYNALFYAPAEPLIGQTVSFSGRVEDYPTLTDYGCKVTVRMDTDTHPVRALFYFYTDQPDLRPGDRITGAAEFGSARVSREEEVTYHTAKGIYLVADQVEELEIFRPEHLPLSALPATLAHRIRGSVDALFSPEQSAFLKALLSYRATGSLDHWLVKVLRNEFLNQRRDRSRRGEEDLPEHLADPSPTLPEQLIADEEKRRLYSAIARLPVLQRSILLDSVYFGLTDGEIADTHHITRENVRQLRSRAKRRLREELGEEEPS